MGKVTGLRRTVVSLVLVASLVLGLVVAVPASAALTFTALEIFAAEEALTVPEALDQNPQVNSDILPAGLPAGSLALFVIQGVVTAKDSLGQEWQIGSPPVFVYTSADTRVDNAPGIGDLVKVIAVRSLAAGPLVAERITLRQLGPQAAAAADVETAFLFSGLVTRAANDFWTVGGFSFIVNDVEFPAAIDIGLGVGDTVTVEFTAAGVLDPLPPAAPDEVRFEGTVSSIDGDLWQIGGFLVLVNEATRLEGEPDVGSLVEVRGLTQADGTILAERIRAR